MLNAVPGACIVTGTDGDGLFASWNWALAHELFREPSRIRPTDARYLAATFVPRRIRAHAGHFMRSDPEAPAWLTPAASKLFARSVRANTTHEPAIWRPRLEWYQRLRYVQMARRTLGTAAEFFGGSAEHPLLNRRVLSAIAQMKHGSRRRRSTAYLSLQLSLLPPALLARRDKARFGGAFHTDLSRRFVSGSMPSHCNSRWVDLGELRRSWNSPRPDARSALLLQTMWLQDEIR